MDTVLRIHWLGKKNISADTNAVTLMRIWNLPESAKLQAQTFDKLSLAPGRFLRGETNSPSAKLLRPLLDDLADEESYLEVRRAASSTNAADQTVLAIHLNDQRAALWETNLAAALESLTGVRATNSQPSATNSVAGWSLGKPHAPNLIELARVGEWTIVGAAQDHNDLMDEISAQFRVNPKSVPVEAHEWLKGLVSAGEVASLFSSGHANVPTNLPTISFSLTGEDQNVRTVAQLNFPSRAPLVLGSWNIPTNLIAPQLTSFTAVRGFQDLLSSSKFWTDLHADQPPDQVCSWALQGFPAMTYFSAPSPDASNIVSKISDLVLEKSSAWFPSNRYAEFQKSKSFNGLEWHGLPYMSPFLESTLFNSNSFIVGGFLGQERMEGPPPPSLLPQLNDTNLVAYNWEMTGPRIDQWLYMGQFARVVLGKAQLPADAAALAWLKAATHQLAFSATQVTQTAPGQLSINRRSSIGFTAMELNLIADWLESPNFPRGLHSMISESTLASPAPAP